jgi:hypothetical protein
MHFFKITRVFKVAGFIKIIVNLANLDLNPPDSFNIGKFRIEAYPNLFMLFSPISINLCL